MEKYYLTINVGSASKKYAIYNGDILVSSVHIEKADLGPQNLADFLGDHSSKISAIGFRIVAPGEYFQSSKVIDDVYIQKLAEVENEEPLHIGLMRTELQIIKDLLPQIKIIGVSDSEFHKNLSDVARAYAVPQNGGDKNTVHKIGYHGISLSSIVKKLTQKNGTIPKKTIVCHLGSGSSITALLNGISVETSMGYSPLAGIPMATRVGDIDAGAVMHIVKQNNFTIEELENYLYNQCGLLGLSGTTGEMKTLLEMENPPAGGQSDEKAHFAIEVFVYNIRKYIGAYSAVLGGLDMLVFAGTIGERSEILRHRILENMDYLGQFKVEVVETDESSEIRSQIELFVI